MYYQYTLCTMEILYRFRDIYLENYTITQLHNYTITQLHNYTIIIVYPIASLFYQHKMLLQLLRLVCFWRGQFLALSN